MANEPWYERLNPTDATFLHLEDEHAHMHVGGVFVYQGRPPSHREFVRFVTSRLDRVPRYRQRLASVPLGAARPVWIDDDHFDPSFHLPHSALPSPGDDEALKRAAARIFGRPLDRSRPLWELELVEGLSGDRFAIVSKTHHSVLDGIAGNDVITAITDDQPVFGPTGITEPWTPRPAPSRRALLVDALREQAQASVAAVRGAFESGSAIRTALREVALGALPMAALALRGRAPVASLNEPIGPHRAYEMTSVQLATIKLVRAATGATVNDVVLAIVAAALRTVLIARGDPLRDDLRAFVPVNVRPPDASGVINNQVAAVFCPLPLSAGDPVTRLRRISSSMTGIKRSGQAAASVALVRLGAFAPPALAARAARMEIAYRRFNLVISNVPGPSAARYFLGRRLLAFHPLIPLSSLQTLSVGAYSYDGAIHFGLLADRERVTDLPVFARAIPEALEELVRAVAPQRDVSAAPEPARSTVPQPVTGARRPERPPPAA